MSIAAPYRLRNSSNIDGFPFLTTLDTVERGCSSAGEWFILFAGYIDEQTCRVSDGDEYVRDVRCSVRVPFFERYLPVDGRGNVADPHLQRSISTVNDHVVAGKTSKQCEEIETYCVVVHGSARSRHFHMTHPSDSISLTRSSIKTWSNGA